MRDIRYTQSPGIPHGSMAEDFLSHKKGSEWWYSTGYLQDESGRMFGFQYTLAKVNVYGIKFHMLLTSLTDYATGQHYFEQTTAFFGRNVVSTADKTGLAGKAEMTYRQNELDSKGLMTLDMAGRNYTLHVDMNAVKPPVWHCDNGILKMGIPGDPKETTFYYSYTNLVSAGKLVFEGREFNLTGEILV